MRRAYAGDGATRLAMALGDLPLALEQAAALAAKALQAEGRISNAALADKPDGSGTLWSRALAS